MQAVKLCPMFLLNSCHYGLYQEILCWGLKALNLKLPQPLTWDTGSKKTGSAPAVPKTNNLIILVKINGEIPVLVQDNKAYKYLF